MIGDQRHVLGQVLGLLRAGTADALLVAGDVYDKSQPSSEAVALVDWFLQGVADTGVPAIVIPGNHDSAERVAYAGGLLSRQGIHMAPAFDGRIEPVMLADEHGPVAVWPIPFLHPAQIRHFLPDAKADTYTDAFRALVASLPLDASVRNVAVVHQFVTAAGVTVERSDSEVSVGGLDNVDASVFDPFDYVALGHIHRAQRVGRDCVRYAGSLLKYSLSEAMNTKSVPVISLGAKGNVTVETIPLHPMRDLRHIRGPMKKLLSPENVESPGDFIYVTLTDEDIINDAMQIFQQVYPNTVKIEFDNSHTRQIEHVDLSEIGNHRSFSELISDFYMQMYGSAISDEEMEIMRQAAKEAGVIDETG